MEVFLIWLVFAVLVGVLANSRGRSGFGFFLLSVLLSPLIGLIIVLVIKNLSNVAIAAEQAVIQQAVSAETHVKCPDCAEFVRKEAKVCKHCGAKLVPQEVFSGERREGWR